MGGGEILCNRIGGALILLYLLLFNKIGFSATQLAVISVLSCLVKEVDIILWKYNAFYRMKVGYFQ